MRKWSLYDGPRSNDYGMIPFLKASHQRQTTTTSMMPFDEAVARYYCSCTSDAEVAALRSNPLFLGLVRIVQELQRVTKNVEQTIGNE